MTSNSAESVNYPNLPESISEPSPIYPIRKGGKTKWLLSLVSLGLVAGGGYVAYQRVVIPQQQQQAHQRIQVVPVERTNLAVTVSANGIVEPEQTVNVSPKTAGILKSLLVKEGDSVSQGQVIAYMDDSDLQGQLTQAQGQLAAAQANLEKLKAGNRSEDIAQAQARLTSAQADLKQAEDDLRRNRDLFEAGAISRQAYNRASTVRNTADAKRMETQQALMLSQAGSRQEDIAAATAQVKAAKGTLQTIQSQINNTEIKAPFSGTVTRKYADPGAFVTPTTAGSSVSSATSSSILSLASTNQVVANVAESNIAQIRIGQLVSITADAYPGKTFQGRVTQIATQAIVEQNVTSFRVKVALLNGAAQQLRAGMNVSAEFNVGQVPNALTVPSTAINRQKNVTGVFVGAPNQPPRFVPITTGKTINNRTEVKSGLDGTEHVLLNVPPQGQPQPGFSLTNLFGGSPSDGPPGGGPPGGPPGGGGPPSGGPPGGGGGGPH